MWRHEFLCGRPRRARRKPSLVNKERLRSTPPTRKRVWEAMVNIFWIHGCGNKQGVHASKRFYRIPTARCHFKGKLGESETPFLARRREWLRQIHKQERTFDSVKHWHRVCSDRFLGKECEKIVRLNVELEKFVCFVTCHTISTLFEQSKQTWMPSQISKLKTFMTLDLDYICACYGRFSYRICKARLHLELCVMRSAVLISILTYISMINLTINLHMTNRW